MSRIKAAELAALFFSLARTDVQHPRLRARHSSNPDGRDCGLDASLRNARVQSMWAGRVRSCCAPGSLQVAHGQKGMISAVVGAVGSGNQSAEPARRRERNCVRTQSVRELF